MTLKSALLLSVLAALPALADEEPSSQGEFAKPPPKRGGPTPAATRVYVRSVPDRLTFDRYSKVVGSDRFSKFIIDIKSGDIYFIDVNVFKIHADFVLGVLLKQPWTADNIRAYNKNYERIKPRFILGYLTEHIKIKKFTFAFWEGDKIDAPTIKGVRDKLNASFFIKDLPFRPDSAAQEKVAKQVKRLGIQTITNDAIYKAAPYQAFNKGRAVGKLRVVPKGTPFEKLIFDRDEIVLLQESYPDISPVAGIITTKFSTPLSHVNLRARSWRIPNAGLVDAFRLYGALDGQVVLLEVADNRHTLRKASAAEIAAFEKRRTERRTVPVPPADLKTANLAMLSHISSRQATTYGAKTANLGEIASASLPLVNVPAGFGVPFFYYRKHLVDNGIDKQISALLADKRFAKDAAWRKAALEKLRKAITEAPMDPRVADALYKRVRLKLGGRGVFVRSSTNAEDLHGFNGAGLYDTVPNVRGKKALAAAVKTVWASLWNFRAVEERDLFGIDHKKTYAGVLIQTGVNATAAGVLISKNLYDPSDDDSYTINAKRGLGIRVVEGTRVPEQVIYDTSNQGTKIISRSDDPVMLVFDENGGIREVENKNRGVILSESRARTLGEAVKSFVPLFSSKSALDVEWLLEGEKVWIVQARPYVE